MEIEISPATPEKEWSPGDLHDDDDEIQRPQQQEVRAILSYIHHLLLLEAFNSIK